MKNTPTPTSWLIILAASLLATLSAYAQSVDPSRPAGEPYELLSKKIVFTTWYHVRPGFFEWVDANGKSVYADKEVKLKSGEARFAPLDSPVGINLFVEPAKHEIPIIKADQAWEKAGISPKTLLVDKGLFRLWAVCSPEIDNALHCYFESKDGINWTRPTLNLVEYNGSKLNNLIPKVSKNISVFIDPSAPAEARYKSISYDPSPKIGILEGFVSPDGLSWTKLEKPLASGEFDTQNIPYYDTTFKKYVFYLRHHMVGPRATDQRKLGGRWHADIKRRSIGRVESDTFGNLAEEEMVLEPTPEMHPSDSFYTNCYTTIPGAPDHHLMFPAIYNSNDDQTKIAAYASYNGRNWHRLPGSPVFDTQAQGELDGGCVFACPNLTERTNGDWVLPYTGYDVPHKYPRGLYRTTPGMMVWPKGRLAGVEAKENGEFATIAFVAPGTTMRINAVTDLTGYIEIEVADTDGKPLKGHSFADAVSISGDQYKTMVTWKGSNSIGAKKGEPVFLRFKLKMAKIYEIYFED